MDFCKNTFVVFLDSLAKNAQKRTKNKKSRKKKSDGGWVGLGFCKCTGGSVDFVLAAPRPITPGQSPPDAKGRRRKK
jgi:hypothetical protein